MFKLPFIIKRRVPNEDATFDEDARKMMSEIGGKQKVIEHLANLTLFTPEHRAYSWALIAYPIERARDVFPQNRDPKKVSPNRREYVLKLEEAKDAFDTQYGTLPPPAPQPIPALGALPALRNIVDTPAAQFVREEARKGRRLIPLGRGRRDISPQGRLGDLDSPQGRFGILPQVQGTGIVKGGGSTNIGVMVALAAVTVVSAFMSV